MLRRIGLFHPGIFKRNVFILFYTANPDNYGRALNKMCVKIHRGDNLDWDEFGFPNFIDSSHISYSAAQFSDYKRVHYLIHKYLNEQCSKDVPVYSDKKIRFPIVTLPDELINSESCLTSWITLIENALKE